jgi:hypothetical protein
MNPISPAATVLDEVATWAGVTTQPTPRGATAIVVEGQELGHVHSDRSTLDLPLSADRRAHVLEAGRAKEWFSDWVTKQLASRAGCGGRDRTVARKLRRAASAACVRRKEPAVTILFAYDGSESANAVIPAAGKLLNHDRSDAVVLTVWNHSSSKRYAPHDSGGHLQLLLAESRLRLAGACCGPVELGIVADELVERRQILVQSEHVRHGPAERLAGASSNTAGDHLETRFAIGGGESHCSHTAPTGSVVTSICSSRLSSFGGGSATPWEATVRRKSTGSPFGPFSPISSASAIGDTCHVLGPLRLGAGSGRYFCVPLCGKNRTLRSMSRLFRPVAGGGLNRL